MSTFEMVNEDPFCPVRLSRFMNGDKPTDKVFVELQAEDGTWKDPQGTAIVHGEGYQLITNQAMHDLMGSVISVLTEKDDMVFQPLSPRNLLWNGKAFIERWYCPSIKIDTPVGGQVMMGIEARNSYDKSSRAQLGFYAMHVTCHNQFHSRNLFGEPFSVRHVNSDGSLTEDVDGAVEKVVTMAQNFGRITTRIKGLCDAHLATVDQYYDFLNRCEATTGLVLDDKRIRKELCGIGTTSKVEGLDVDYAQYGGKDSLWGLVNAYSAISTHESSSFGAADKCARFVDFAIDEVDRMLAGV